MLVPGFFIAVKKRSIWFKHSAFIFSSSVTVLVVAAVVIDDDDAAGNFDESKSKSGTASVVDVFENFNSSEALTRIYENLRDSLFYP